MSRPQPLALVRNDMSATFDQSGPSVGDANATIIMQPNRLLLIQFDYVADESAAQHPIDILLDGSLWATLPATRRPEEKHRWTLSCGLPAKTTTAAIHLECRDAVGKVRILSAKLGDAPPLTNSQGLLASDVFDPSMHALFSAPWLEFDGAFLTVSGAHLPPFGNPDLLYVEFEEGVSGTFEYPLASPEFAAHYWYWPNAHMSGFRVRINLAASVAGSDAFTFRFTTRPTPKSASTAVLLVAPSDSWPDRSRMWIPYDLRSCMGHPSNDDQMTRVQTWSNQKTVTFTGYNAFKAFECLAAQHGLSSRERLKVLDWGCGHGRVTRHFIENWPEASVSGTDIDPENIAWCAEHLPNGTFNLASLWPPLNVPDNSYDLIVGLSVMTHLSAKAQDAWINEINRVLKPGGLALITFGGNAAAAFSSVHQSPEWWRNWRETGFNDKLLDPALEGKIDDASYYRVTHQSPQRARAAWSRVMTVEDIKPQAFGYQDVAVLRAR